MTGVIINSGFPGRFKRDAAQLYYAAFEGKIGGILGRDGRGIDYIISVIDPAHAISAVSEDGEQLLGIAGFKTAEGAMVGGEFNDLANTYGWFGAIWRGLVLSLLERELEDDALLMDGIAVAEIARGKGVGTKLLDAILNEARIRGKKRVRLDVIDTNPRAKALYQRVGFIPVGEEQLGLLRHVFGFNSATKMELDV